MLSRQTSIHGGQSESQALGRIHDRRGHSPRNSFMFYFYFAKNQQSFITWPFNFVSDEIE
jgi:hypothetical protein